MKRKINLNDFGNVDLDEIENYIKPTTNVVEDKEQRE